MNYPYTKINKNKIFSNILRKLYRKWIISISHSYLKPREVKPKPFTQIMKILVAFVALTTVVSVFSFGIYQQLSGTCPAGKKKEL
ncbi:hypothetical protein PN492_19550 [Dolichospermum circinale CS-537/01]|uniref:Uncharacterized protein n=1 Tax=Dolichospermum circinale CS-537/01 TaxID=3021739 RepID=A0ABT5A9Y1_9CYAN|nr:hypothetical protein [Dolichospermum circinale]MDB9488717.1 hypothetical protein [Dolichospermum circinale CS-537/01]